MDAKGYTIGSTLTLLKLGVFEAVPTCGSIASKELAQQCKTEEQLLSLTTCFLLLSACLTDTQSAS